MNAKQKKTAPLAVYLRGGRIVTGIVLLAFVTTHLLNLILGMYSVALIEQARPYLTGAWTGVFGSKFLGLMLMTHFFLALEAIYRRKTMRMSANDLVQFLAGLAIVPLLIPHIIGIGATREIMSDADFNTILRFFWQQDPFAGLRQVLLLGILWVHGCLGLFMWMRSKIWAIRILPWLYPLAVAIPVLALLGYVAAGREVLIAAKAAKDAQAQLVAPVDTPSAVVTPLRAGGNGANAAIEQDEPKLQHLVPASKLTTEQIIERSKQETRWTIRGALALVLLILLLRGVRMMRIRRDKIKLDYLDGPLLESETGPSLLDIARNNDLPHAHICNGRGRCGTCRVRIIEGGENLPEPQQLEQDTLDRLGCGRDVRLACQLHPIGGYLQVERLLPADYVLSRKKRPHKDADNQPEVAE